jgi:outer membrane biosynthesis protein TonB
MGALRSLAKKIATKIGIIKPKAPAPAPTPAAAPKPAAAKPAPKPTPKPTPAPKSAAEPTPAPKPTPAPAPAPAPKPAPTPEPVAAKAAPEPTEVKGVRLDDPAAVVAAANTASDESLEGAGVKGNQLKTLVQGRPYADVDSLANTAGVGKKTLRALVELAGR